MPRKPPAHEARSFEEIYLDETSQTGHRFLIIGGIVIPQQFSEQFEQDILEARRPRLAAERPGSAELREMGWKKVSNGDFEAYRRVVDAYFNFAGNRMKSGDGTVEFHCSVVNTQVRGRAFSGQRGKVGFSKEVFFHCMTVARYHKKKLFHVYLDARETGKPIDLRLRNMLCRRLKRGGRPQRLASPTGEVPPFPRSTSAPGRRFAHWRGRVSPQPTLRRRRGQCRQETTLRVHPKQGWSVGQLWRSDVSSDDKWSIPNLGSPSKGGRQRQNLDQHGWVRSTWLTHSPARLPATWVPAARERRARSPRPGRPP